MSSPRLARYFLQKILRFEDNPYILGDFEETFNDLKTHKGSLIASLWYWWQLVKSLFPFLRQNIIWGGIMFKHNLKFIFRNILKQKVHSFINLFGLVIGMMSVIFIALWVMDEISYDKFHQDVERIFRIVRIDKTENGDVYIQSTPNPMAPTLMEEYPEVEFATRTNFQSGLVKVGDKEFNERNVCFTDPFFFKIFNYPLKSGTYFGNDGNINSIIISEDMAVKYFGDENPIGKLITFKGSHQFTVCGVIENVPENSSVKFNMVCNYDYLKNLGVPIDEWGQSWSRAYVKLHPWADVEKFDQEIKGLVKKHRTNSRFDLGVQNYGDIHLLGIDSSGDGLTAVYLYSAVAFLILLIACINFINLTTARSMNRLKEVGVRKVIGAEKIQLISQFLGESVLLSLFALMFSVLLVELFLTDFNNLLGKSLSLDFSSPAIIILLVVISLVTGILSGLYPAYVLSSHKPSQIFHDRRIKFNTKSTLRNVLIVVQYTISVTLILSIIVVNDQVDFILNKDLGMKKENMLYFSLDNDLKTQSVALKKELLRYNDVQSVSFLMDFPYAIDPMTDAVSWEGKNPESFPSFTFAGADFDFIKTFEINLIKGRDFSEDYSTDSSAVIVNRKAADLMGGESIVGKFIELHNEKMKVIGMTENFHCRPLNENYEPVLIVIAPQYSRFGVVKVSNVSSQETRDFVEQCVEKFSSNKNIAINILEDHYAVMYTDEENLKDVLFLFAIVAVILSCLGLFSISAFMAERRTREVGIRKVLGAEIIGLIYLLSFDFLKWVLISNLLAAPIAYYFLSAWLQNYAFGTEINPGYFILAGIISVAVSVLTIIYHLLKTAFNNPVNTLKYE